MGEYAPGMPAWVKRYPSRSIGASKTTLIDLWSRALHADQQGCDETSVWAKQRPDHTPGESLICDVAEGTGQTYTQVRDHLTLLRKKGLVETSGRSAILTWSPCCDDARSVKPPRLSDTTDRARHVSEDSDSEHPEPESVFSESLSVFSESRSGISEPQLTPSVPPTSPNIPQLDPRGLLTDPHESTPTSTTPIAPPTPEARPPQVNDDPTSTECDTGATGTQASMFGSAPPTPKRDLAAEVFTYFTEAIARTREEQGMRKTKGATMNPKYRKWVKARIDDHGGGDDGVTACKHAIDVQSNDARRAGTDTKANGWKYFTPAMFSNGDVFATKSLMWSEDGRHESFGNPSARGRTNGRRGPNVSGHNLHKEFPCDGT